MSGDIYLLLTISDSNLVLSRIAVKLPESCPHLYSELINEFRESKNQTYLKTMVGLFDFHDQTVVEVSEIQGIVA